MIKLNHDRKGVLQYTPTSMIPAILSLALVLFLGCSSDDGGDDYPEKGNDIGNYKTVKIGSYTWMAENLDYKVSGSKCYDNNSANCKKYGRLYTWEAAMDACPVGWHLPTNAEWDALFRFADSTSGIESPYNSETAGKHLKAVSGWNNKDEETSGNGTDYFNFAALPGGGGYSGGGFSSVGDYGGWWSASDYYDGNAYGRSMYYDNEYASWNNYHKASLRSVRCVH